MKKIYFLFLLVLLPLVANAQVKRSINVETAGTLSTLISDGEKYTIDELTLTGELNGTDLRLVREMVGCDYLGQLTQGKVTKLDLSGVRIVAGGEKYLDTKEIFCSSGNRTTNSNGFIFYSEDNVLGDYLFAGCDKLEEIILPNSITKIGNNVFHFGYGLTSLTIPKNVTSIGSAVIIYCNNIVSLTVESGNTVFSTPNGSNAVVKGTTLVLACSETVIPNNITTIGRGAFYGIGKWGAKLTIPSSVTTIENDAFSCSNYSEIEIPEGLKTIGEYAFGWTPIQRIQIPASVTKIGYRAFFASRNLESIEINTNNSIYDSRGQCNAIIETASNTVIQGCKNTVIPQSVKIIGSSAFEQLHNMESFTIPSWIESIGERAFADSQNLKEITSEIVDPTTVKMGWDVFSNYNQNIQRILYVPSGTKSAYEAINVWKKDFYEIKEKEPEKKEVTLHVATAGTLPSLISSDEKYDITDLILTGELNGTDFRLLRDMAGNDYQGNLTNGKLSKLDLSGTTIVSGGDYYINTTTINWTDNTQMVLVNPVQLNTNNNELGSFLFAGCKSLATIILPKNLTAIGSSTFSHNPKLRSLEIPQSVSSLSMGFIQECENLSSLSVESGNQTYSSPEGSNAVIRTADMELEAGCKNTIIPSGTKIIGAYAFQHCISLVSIKIPESVTTIRDFAFWGCNGLTELKIPASVTQIGNMTFYGCSALNSIAVDATNTVYDSRNNCNALIETSSNTLLLGCKNTIIPNDIQIIGENAFRPCDGLTSIEIPASVISIRDNAFAYCYQLKRVVSNIVDPNSVVMGSTVFDKISESAILIVPQGTKASYLAADGWKDAFSNIVEMGSQDPNTIDVAVAGTLSSLLVNPMQIEELTLTGDLNGTDLRLIREMAGNDYLGKPTNGMLKKLDLSGANIVAGGEKYLDTDKVTSSTGTYTQMGGDFFHFATEDNVLGNSLFAGCDKLEEVILPNSITSIGNYVFWYCLNLSSLVIPEKVSNIGWSFIFGPNKLTNLSVAEGNPYYSSPANSNALMQGTKLVYGIPSTVVPAGTTVIGSSAFADCGGLGEITLPEGVTTIESYAFENSGLTGIIMPNSLSTIGEGAFAVCWGLKSFTLPKSVTNIDGSAFMHCSNLTALKVEDGNTIYDSRDNCNAIIETATNKIVCGSMNTVIPKSVTSIGDDAFREFQQMQSFNIPNWITSIGERAFMYGGLTSIAIPASVTSIGNKAFAWNHWLKSVSVEAKTPLSIAENVFTDRQNLILYVPTGCKNAYASADYWKDFKDIVEAVVEETVVYAPKEEDKTVTVQSSDESEKEVSILSIVIIEDEQYEVTVIAEGAFENNEMLEKVSIPETITMIGDNAFAGCSNLKEIHVYAEEPIKLGTYSAALTRGEGENPVFSGVNMSECILYVPAGSKDKYAQAEGWKDFQNIVEMAGKVIIKIGTANQLTYCSDKDLDFKDVEGLKVYVATGYDKTTGTIWLTRVKDVPANTGFLMMGDAGKYEVPVKEGGSNAYYMNLFKGTIEAMTLQMSETIDNKEYMHYYLSNGQYGVGFYKVSADGVAIGANRAYLSVPTEIPAVGTAGGTETIKVSAAGQVPYYSANSLDFTDVDGIKAYTATGYDYNSSTIWLTRVKKVPAETGILIMANKGEYEVPKVSVASIYGNMFKGSVEASTIYTNEQIAGKDYVNYYLSSGVAGVGFYKVTNPDGQNLPANRCYLPIPKQTASTRGMDDDPTDFSVQESDEVIALRVFGSGTTGIETNNREPKTNNHWYNLQGQRVENPGKGLYIRNGKKVIIK